MSLPGFGFSEKKPDSHVDQDPLTSGSFRSYGAKEPAASSDVFAEEGMFERRVEDLVRRYLEGQKLSAASVYSDPVKIGEITRKLSSTSSVMGIGFEDVSRALFNIAKGKSKAA